LRLPINILTIKASNELKGSTGHNSTYKKLGVQWLNEALCFLSSSLLADSLVLRNRHFRVAANRQTV